MKKDAVGIIESRRNPTRKKRLHPVAWLLCLLAAVVIWLTVVDLQTLRDESDEGNDPAVTTESAS